MRVRAPLVVAAMAALQIVPAHAAVTRVTNEGFVVTLSASLAAPPAGVYRALTASVGSWWNAEHTYSGDSKNLSIDARPGGCFCERLPNGGGVEHLRVIYAKPGEMLRLSGALGPLQASGLAGTMTWTLMPSEAGTGGGTTITLTYVVGGFREGGLTAIAPAVDGVLSEQLQRLKRFVETGKPTA